MLHQYLAVFNELFAEILPKLHEHFLNESFPTEMWLIKWFQSCFLYSFPFDLCIRAWDNILAYGTRFLFNMTLAILKSVETQLLELDMAEICEYMKLMKQEDG